MIRKFYLSILFITSFLFAWTACSDSGTGNQPGDLTGESAVYELSSSENSGLNGKITFEERIDGYTVATVELTGTEDDEEYLVHIYSNTSLESGELLIKLNSVDGESGMSEKTVSADEEGDTVTYEDLLEMNAHIAVYEKEDTETVLSVTDIGENALTGESLEVEIEETENSGVTGDIQFLERKNGSILAVIELNGLNGEGEPAARLYKQEEENGTALLKFSHVDAETGISKTNISELEDGSDFAFEDLEELEAYLAVYRSETDLTVIAEAELNGDSE